MENRKPTQHRMTRRSAAHNYTSPGVYHITMHVADGIGQVLGCIAGSLDAAEGSADAPHTVLSHVGQMVEHELLHSIHAHYAMITIQDYVIMPEHLHFLAVVQDKIISQKGKVQPIGRVLSGFKQGCNRRYWEWISQRAELAATLTAAPAPDTASTDPAAAPAVSAPGGFAAGVASTAPAAAPAVSAPGGFAAGVASTDPAAAPAVSAPGGFAAGVASTDPAAAPAVSAPGGFAAGRQPLFAPGFCDVMPVDAAQLATQRAYITGNPRSRLLRSSGGARTHVQRGGTATALSPSALSAYLRRECGAAFTPDAWQTVSGQLLTAPDGTVGCDTFGDRRLLSGRLLPVVCHRKDAARINEQKMRCLEEAAQGAVLVSGRIAKGEQAIMDEAVGRGFPVVLIADNGFADRYHPSQERLDRCADGRLLIVSPWLYRYRPKDEAVTVTFCKTMNCVAQALCRKKDSWWKEQKA